MQQAELCLRLEYLSKRALRQNVRSLLFQLHQHENRRTTNRGLLGQVHLLQGYPYHQYRDMQHKQVIKQTGKA